VAFNGKETLILFKKLQHKLVSLELLLPKINGYNVSRKFRINPQIPIITSLRHVANLKEIFNLGVIDCLLKPFLLKLWRRP
jgi:DNA-binding response OmpR family regulator